MRLPKYVAITARKRTTTLKNVPKKIPYNNQEKENTILNNPIHPKQTYTKTVTSTPKPVETPFLHPMTKLKFFFFFFKFIVLLVKSGK